MEPSWTSLLPPLCAIGMAVVLRQVLLALLAGLWLGAWLIGDEGPHIALLRVVDKYLVEAMADSGNASILLFSLMLGGLIGLIRQNGGGAGLAQVVTRLATDTRRGQLASWGLGVMLFFDDYASTLLVGSSLRPVTDRLRISREKLAYIADASAASIASVALASSWIGVELGYIADQAKTLGMETNSYALFMESLPYRFYPWLMLAFGVMVALTGRDFGPMHAAEQRARQQGVHAAAKGVEGDRKGHWALAVLPIMVAVVTILLGMWLEGAAALKGKPATFANVLSGADAARALMWGSLFGGLCAALLSIVTRALSLHDTVEAWTEGVRSVVLAMMVLVSAWALGAICRELHTADYLIQVIGDTLPAVLVPAVVFVVAALTSFATGTSWGTMGILFPLAVPLAHELSQGNHELVVSTIASILAGSVWGDHCSPISDTTIMSSMAAGCDHIEHVRTQAPYAIAVGLVSVLAGDVATGLGLYPPAVGLLVGGVLLYGVLRVFGKPTAA